MNTVVFVLMVLTHNANWVPTIEFTAQAKCERAAIDMKKQADHHVMLGEMREPWCARIEK